MKNKYTALLIAICLITFLFSLGFGGYNDTSLYWYFPKDVGIYTTSPGAELHVAGTTPEVRIGDDDAEDTAITFMGNAQDFYIALDDTLDDLVIGTGTTIGSNVKMVIENGGNIGIGTAAPSSELNIVQTDTSTDLYVDCFDNGAGYPWLLLRKSDSDTIGTFSETDSSDVLGIFGVYGVDSGSNADYGANIKIVQNGAAGAKVPTNIYLETFSSTEKNTNQLLLESDGDVGINTSTPGGQLDISPGTTGGLYFEVGEATVNMSDTNAVTCQVNVPSGSKIIGCQLRVDTALAGGDTWDAAYSGGSTQSIASNQAVTKNTKVNAFYDENAASANISSEADVVISKNGGGHFTAQGTIRAIVYYNAFTAMGDAS